MGTRKNVRRRERDDSKGAFVAFRCPAELHGQALARMEGQYDSLSEYLRDLLRRDLERMQQSSRAD